jgi:16S rRNA processing protein RimM
MPEFIPSEEHEWVWLARIRHPQGRRGEVFADILTDFPEKFSDRKMLVLVREDQALKPRPVQLQHHWLHKGGVVLHFEGVNSISDAEQLTGLTVAIPRAERVSLGEGEVYIGDLVGCTLIDIAHRISGQMVPRTVGVIENVDRTAGPVALLIVRNGPEEVLVPFARNYLRGLDLDARRVEMELPDGLIELNRP